MKPNGLGEAQRKFPITDYSFHAGMGEWHGYSSPSDGEDSEQRKFNDFSCKFLMEASEARAREMAVFVLLLLASAWPLIYMMIMVTKLLIKRPFDA